MRPSCPGIAPTSSPIGARRKCWRPAAPSPRRIAEAEATVRPVQQPPSPAVAEAAKAAADASPQERQAMIDAMVERLAARLAAQPDDVDGWARLGRSYMVLDQPAKARDAYAR